MDERNCHLHQMVIPLQLIVRWKEKGKQTQQFNHIKKNLAISFSLAHREEGKMENPTWFLFFWKFDNKECMSAIGGKKLECSSVWRQCRKEHIPLLLFASTTCEKQRWKEKLRLQILFMVHKQHRALQKCQLIQHGLLLGTVTRRSERLVKQAMAVCSNFLVMNQRPVLLTIPSWWPTSFLLQERVVRIPGWQVTSRC